jgi:hypothetical protein
MIGCEEEGISYVFIYFLLTIHAFLSFMCENKKCN